MKLAIVILALAGAAMACDNERDREEFESFQRRFRKTYANEQEYEYRCGVFGRNLANIEAHNGRFRMKMESFQKGVTQFTDLLPQEFIEQSTGFIPEAETRSAKNGAKQLVVDPTIKNADSIDWRVGGWVTPVKDQGKCGSCWSFATVAVMESRCMIKHNKPFNQDTDLSEQHFLECADPSYGNQKCLGGNMINTYGYMQKTGHGSQQEIFYPYTSHDGKNGSSSCHYNPDHTQYRMLSYTDIKRGDEAQLLAGLQTGPVAMAVNACPDKWQFYTGGVMTDTSVLPNLGGCSPLALNHAVLCVGYTKDYYIVKNSWSETWGEAGYVRISRSHGNKNQFGLFNMNSFLTCA